MSFKFTLVLLALAIVAVAGFGIAQRQAPPAAPQASGPAAQPTATLLDFSAGAVTSLDIKTKDHETSLTIDGASWKLVKPEADPNVDQTKVNTVVTQLYALKSPRSVAQPGDDITPYGLRNPQLTVVLSGGGKTETLIVGDKNVNGSEYYATRQEGSAVGLIPSSLVTTLTGMATTPPKATPTPSRAATALPSISLPAPSASG